MFRASQKSFHTPFLVISVQKETWPLKYFASAFATGPSSRKNLYSSGFRGQTACRARFGVRTRPAEGGEEVECVREHQGPLWKKSSRSNHFDTGAWGERFQRGVGVDCDIEV